MMERERILELPLGGRKVTDLVVLTGAAVQVGQSPTWGMNTGVNISAAGGRGFGVGYSLDGAMHTNRFDATNMPLPFPDSLQEFRVNTSTQDASTARSSGASVSSVTKSGTNAFHGDAFWYVRNSVFNAQQASATRKDQLKRNQFGGTIGGPVLKNKLFFFAGYQGTEERNTPSGTLSIVQRLRSCAAIGPVSINASHRIGKIRPRIWRRVRLIPRNTAKRRCFSQRSCHNHRMIAGISDGEAQSSIQKNKSSNASITNALPNNRSSAVISP